MLVLGARTGGLGLGNRARARAEGLWLETRARAWAMVGARVGG